MGDIARLHSAVISYARDFMIDRGFTYVVPPFMIRSNVVTGVMSFAEMEAVSYTHLDVYKRQQLCFPRTKAKCVAGIKNRDDPHDSRNHAGISGFIAG